MPYREHGPGESSKSGEKAERGERWDAREPAKSASRSSLASDDDTPKTDMEPAGHAARVLLQKQGKNEALLKVILQSSFRALRDDEMVPIYPCPYCGDGGMRTAGIVRMPKGRAFVRACDTCSAVEVGEQPVE